MNSFGSMTMYTDAETAHRRERMQRDFAAINWAAQQRADRRALRAEARATGRPTTITAPARPISWLARLQRTPRPAAH